MAISYLLTIRCVNYLDNNGKNIGQNCAQNKLECNNIQEDIKAIAIIK